MSRTFAHAAGVTATTLTVYLPPGQQFYVEPAVLVTVHGAPTDVGITFVYEDLGGEGEAITAITLTFQAGAVGKRFSLLVVGP